MKTFRNLALTTLFAGSMMVADNAQAQYWSLGGNAGTLSNYYVGTSDARSFRIGTNGTTRMTVSSTGNVGIGTTSPSTKMHITGGPLLISGETGNIPSTLSSTTGNFFYYQPLKGAVRFGYKNSNQAVWDTTNMGLYSLAFGNNCQAKGINSIAAGDYAMAWGRNSFSLGQSSQSGGFASFCMGFNAGAAGDYSLASGDHASAGGSHATARAAYSSAIAGYSAVFGQYLEAHSYNSFVIGRYNVLSGSNTTWTSTQPLFVAGNGSGTTARSNAMTLFKNGNMTIAGTLTQSSDMRLKQNVVPVKDVISKISAIQPIYYEFINKELHPEERQLGFSAQEIRAQFPELVREDEASMLSVNYAAMSAVVLQAVKEQQVIIELMSKKIEQLQSQLSDVAQQSELRSTGLATDLRLTINPNPASETIFLSVPASGSSSGQSYKILNYAGQTIAEGLISNSSREEISIAGLSSGTYVMMISEGGKLIGSGTFSKK